MRPIHDTVLEPLGNGLGARLGTARPVFQLAAREKAIDPFVSSQQIEQIESSGICRSDPDTWVTDRAAEIGIWQGKSSRDMGDTSGKEVCLALEGVILSAICRR